MCFYWSFFPFFYTLHILSIDMRHFITYVDYCYGKPRVPRPTFHLRGTRGVYLSSFIYIYIVYYIFCMLFCWLAPMWNKIYLYKINDRLYFDFPQDAVDVTLTRSETCWDEHFGHRVREGALSWRATASILKFFIIFSY